MPPVSHGIPIVSARQWVVGFSPNATNDGWNYIACSWPGGTVQVEWNVIKDLTDVPVAHTQHTYFTPTHHYPNLKFAYNGDVVTQNQMRLQNGRILFPLNDNYFACYDPTTEAVTSFGPIVEVPPVDPNASTIPYSMTLDTAGNPYFATQESQYRSSWVGSIDPTTLAITSYGAVGSGALSYTTYGFYIVADTITANKFIYVAYGENPWQLWALNITPGPNYGVATKLYEVSSTGNIAFTDITGQGWVATIHTNLGNPSDVITKWWCLDGAIYPYTVGQPPPAGAPATRNVTPLRNLLVGPPAIDSSGGAGVVGWRNGSSGPYNYVNYTVTNSAPIGIESLVATNGEGIAGNGLSYNGFFQDVEPAGTLTWYGPYSLISEGPGLNVDGEIYRAGYPNGVIIDYNPDAAWQSAGNVNPRLIGYIGLNGTQYAGIKYARTMAWAPGATPNGRLYVAGDRERNGSGCGIGYWVRGTTTLAGTYSAAGMTTVLNTGLCVLSGISRIVMSTSLITPPGSALLYVFDYDLNFIAALTPILGLTSLGQIYETQTANVITGVVQGSGNSLGLWQYNVQTQTFIQYVELPFVGTLGAQCQLDGSHQIMVMMGNNLVRVDLTALTGILVADLTSIAPISCMSFDSDASTLWLAGGVNSGINSAELFSLAIQNVLALGSITGAGSITDVTFTAGGAITLILGGVTGVGFVNPMTFGVIGDVVATTGANVVSLQNDEGSQLVFGQPVYSSGSGRIRLADASSVATSIVIGLVADATIEAQVFGNVALASGMIGTTAQWDAVCGTVGGLAAGTTYYLHPTIPGRLTSVAPSVPGQIVVPVIRAYSPTEAVLATAPPIVL